MQSIFIKNRRNHTNLTTTWEQREVLDLLIQPITDGPHETPELVEDGIPFISVDAIVDNKIDFNRKRGNITESYNLECCKKYKPQLLDVFLVKSGSTVGKVAIVETTDNFNIWSPLAAMRCGDKTNPYFLYFLLQTRDMQAQVADKASNGTQPNLSMRELEKFGTTVPSSIDEQKVIGNYFKSLDHLITLHQRSYNLERKSKTTNAWEQREFENIAERLSATAISSEDLPYVEYEDVVSEQGILNKDISCKEGQKTGIVFSEQNVLYGKLRPYLHNWLNPDFKGVAVGDWWVLNPINADKNFVYRLIQSEVFDTIANQSTGTKMPRADWKLVSKTEFSVPTSLKEQHKIGQYFRNLDHLITLHQRNSYGLHLPQGLYPSAIAWS